MELKPLVHVRSNVVFREVAPEEVATDKDKSPGGGIKRVLAQVGLAGDADGLTEAVAKGAGGK
jgi:hypothetical protein